MPFYKSKTIQERENSYRYALGLFEAYSQAELDMVNPPDLERRLDRLLDSSIPVSDLQLSKNAKRALMYIGSKEYKQDASEDKLFTIVTSIAGSIPGVGIPISGLSMLVTLSQIESSAKKNDGYSSELFNTLSHFEAFSGGAYMLAERQFSINPSFKDIVFNSPIGEHFKRYEEQEAALNNQIPPGLKEDIEGIAKSEDIDNLAERFLGLLLGEYRFEMPNLEQGDDQVVTDSQPEGQNVDVVRINEELENDYANRKSFSQVMGQFNAYIFKSEDLGKALAVFDEFNYLHYLANSIGKTGVTSFSVSMAAVSTTFMLVDLLSTKEQGESFEASVMKALNSIMESLGKIQNSLVRVEHNQQIQLMHTMQLFSLVRSQQRESFYVLKNIYDETQQNLNMYARQEASEKINHVIKTANIALYDEASVKNAVINSFMHALHVSKEPVFRFFEGEGVDCLRAVLSGEMVSALLGYAKRNTYHEVTANPIEYARGVSLALELITRYRLETKEFKKILQQCYEEGKNIISVCKESLSIENCDSIVQEITPALDSFRNHLINELQESSLTHWVEGEKLPVNDVVIDIGQNENIFIDFSRQKVPFTWLKMNEHAYSKASNTGVDVFYSKDFILDGEISKYFRFEPYVLNKHFKRSFEYQSNDLVSKKFGRSVYSRLRHYRIFYRFGPKKNTIYMNNKYQLQVSECAELGSDGNYQLISSGATLLTQTVSRGKNEIHHDWVEPIQGMVDEINLERKNSLKDVVSRLDTLKEKPNPSIQVNQLSAKIAFLEALSRWCFMGKDFAPLILYKNISSECLLIDVINEIQGSSAKGSSNRVSVRDIIKFQAKSYEERLKELLIQLQDTTSAGFSVSVNTITNTLKNVLEVSDLSELFPLTE